MRNYFENAITSRNFRQEISNALENYLIHTEENLLREFQIWRTLLKIKIMERHSTFREGFSKACILQRPKSYFEI